MGLEGQIILYMPYYEPPRIVYNDWATNTAVTGMGPGWFQVSFCYSVCFMIEFDTHDVLCLVSSIVLILSVCYVLCQDIA